MKFKDEWHPRHWSKESLDQGWMAVPVKDRGTLILGREHLPTSWVERGSSMYLFFELMFNGFVLHHILNQIESNTHADAYLFQCFVCTWGLLWKKCSQFNSRKNLGKDEMPTRDSSNVGPSQSNFNIIQIRCRLRILQNIVVLFQDPYRADKLW